MKPPRYAAPVRTKAQKRLAAFMLATLTDETPVSEDAFAAKVEKLAGGR